MKKQLFTLMLAAMTAASAMAVPARRGYIRTQGPDGKEITVGRQGDEFGHWFADSEGRLMKRDGRRMVYMTAGEQDAVRLSARKARAKAAGRRSIESLGKFPYATFPSTGKQKAIVILVQYQDEKFHLGDGAFNYFNSMLNETGFSQHGGTGCAREYFLDSSNGLFDCEFDVFGPVTLKYNMAHYGGNDKSGNDKAPEEMVIEACQQLDAKVDFKEYDRDNDGVIDNVFVIYAGRGEASDVFEQYPNTVWPHSWELGSRGYKFDGKLLDSYGCSNEWEDIFVLDDEGYVVDIDGERPDGVGTFVHEFSHVMGLPDLYHTDASVNYTPGSWSVLDYGPYNNEGRTPPAYSAFERNAMGWIEPTELTEGNHSLQSITASNSAFCISNPAAAEEFYLIEHRTRTGWDAYLPGSGMLIWHVDYDYDNWQANTVNNNSRHQGVDLIEADGKTNKERRDAGDCYPGTSNVTSRSLKWWYDGNVSLALSNIALSVDGSSVHFTAGAPAAGSEDPGAAGNYWTVSDVNAADPDMSEITVAGYIVGYVPSGNFYRTVFGTTGKVENTNLVIADDAAEDDCANCMVVQLKKGTAAQADLNLVAHPEMLGRKVALTGTFDTYCGVNGLKPVTSYSLIDETNSIGEIATPAPASGTVYDLQGRRVANPTRGLYIVNGKKVIL